MAKMKRKYKFDSYMGQEKVNELTHEFIKEALKRKDVSYRLELESIKIIGLQSEQRYIVISDEEPEKGRILLFLRVEEDNSNHSLHFFC